MRVQIDTDSTAAINERYLKHCALVPTLSFGKLRAWHVACARGLYVVLTERALRGDDAVVIGGPHWLTYTSHIEGR